MSFKKQVDADHYNFEGYLTKSRWVSLWHQLDEIRKLKPENVLEIGPGPGVFKMVAGLLGIKVDTLDLDPALRPDCIASATSIPFADSAYDVTCAFQMLEHLPYDVALSAFKEMARVCRRNVVISLPDSQPVWRYHVHIPKFGAHDVLVPRPRLKLPEHKFDGEHYWEVNKRNYPLSRVVADYSCIMRLSKTFRVPENTTHRFFVFDKLAGTESNVIE